MIDDQYHRHTYLQFTVIDMNRYSKDSYISIYVYESAQWALNSLNSWIERKLRQLQPRLCLNDNVFIQFRSLKQEIEIHIQMYPQFLCLWSRLSHLCNLSWVGIFLGRGGDNFRHRGLYHNAMQPRNNYDIIRPYHTTASCRSTIISQYSRQIPRPIYQLRHHKHLPHHKISRHVLLHTFRSLNYDKLYFIFLNAMFNLTTYITIQCYLPTRKNLPW